MSQTIQELKQAIKVATSPQQAVIGLLDLASHFSTFDIGQGIATLRKAQELAIGGNVQPREQIRTLLFLGSLHSDLRHNEDAIHYLEEAAALADVHKESDLKARALGLIGFVYLEFGNHTEALSYYLEELNIARREHNTPAEIDALSGIGLVYGESGNSNEAIIHLEQALALERESGGHGEYVVLNNCALEYAKQGDFERALEYGKLSLALTEENNDQIGAILARNRLGEAYLGLGQHEEANRCFQENLAFLQAPNLQPRRLHTLWNLGRLRIEQKAYQAAIDFLEESLTIAKAADARQFCYEIHEKLAEAHKGLGNFERALAHHEKFHALKESVFDEKSKNARRGLEVAYRTGVAKREAAVLKQKNEELEREIQERKRAEKIALSASRAKSNFLATMSHELRTPLNSIIGFAELAELELTNQENFAIMEDVRRIRKNGLHLLDLVNDVLDMARIETGKLLLYPEKVSPWLIVQEVSEFLPRFAKDGVTFTVTADPELPEIVMDMTRIKQILLNLLSNAFKFTDAGWVKLSAQATAVSVEFIVEDNGIGIPDDQLPILFETFAQVDIPQNRTLRGSGLGLPISRDLARLHGGSITVESNPGKGSKFTLSLPRNAGISTDNSSDTVTAHE